MRCTALIVTFNRLEKLKKTISETLKQPFNDIVIVNNGSTDGTSAWLDSLTDERLSLLNLRVNGGGAGGFKAGSEYINQQIDCDWVVFYDDDAYPEANMLENFSSFASLGHEVFCGAVRDLNANICGMNLPFSRIPATFSQNVDYVRHPERYLPDMQRASVVQSVSFVGMIIRSDILRKYTKDIHSELFIYFDDLYFGYRLSSDGCSILFCPELRFRHDVSIQGRCINPEWKIYYLIRNLFLGQKYFPDRPVFSYGAIYLRIIKYIAQLPFQKNKWRYLSFLCKGITHGIKRISGKQHQ
ncbi:glycosyltransferase [Shimwellia blattae]|uniref:Putative glycosyltransferase n=1 Tax=Shimwellia blattae (strain ATCC 29907 / DSM 4481 / JCM 1650 / NBRC 105725 / CDC 9005-74) TaxID=630626 RepID=I2B7P9_SHIBC|nr:glycosyltransferase [Shimwellia blattae]AFJ46553.1 putative glycosyltransferase [Shimwellia blattae DSM 4481 = NBRC 105725]GAB80132.1 putative glycosyltransferase [Shimwellia blattae DSM 4481 = NBRC 105725]VDY64021.1 N-glycosyltransferase [Shimwellia blattae]VEC22156.1 N-glycosyltransferase [Shimwellia blattae]